MVKDKPIPWFNKHRVPGKLPGNAPQRRGMGVVPQECGTFRAGCLILDPQNSSRWTTATLPAYTDAPSCV